MVKMGKAICLALCGIMLLGAFPMSYDSTAYAIDRFSDGSVQKDIQFSSTVKDGMVYLSVPRATNLTRAELSLEPGTSEIATFHPFEQFAGGVSSNVTGLSELGLTESASWWNASWHYAIALEVNSGAAARRDIAVEMELNLTDALVKAGVLGRTLDESSLRIIEYSQGQPLIYNSSIDGTEKYCVPMGWSPSPEYKRDTNAVLGISWLLSGDTPAQTVRSFMLYFDDTTHGAKPAGAAKLAFWKDILFANWNPYENYGLYYKNTNGSFSNTSTALFPTHASAAVFTGDFNGDGYLDIVYPNWRIGSNYTLDSFVFAGGPDGMDSNVDWFLPTSGAFGGSAGDVNNDGYDDIVFASIRNTTGYSINSTLYYGGPNGLDNTTALNFPTQGATDCAIVDVNRDGLKDIVFANAYNGSSGNINSSLFLNNGAGFNATPDISLFAQNPYAVEAADLNKDGWVDLLFANSMNTSMALPGAYHIDSFIYYGSPVGFSSVPDVKLPTHGTLDAKVADLNQDGWLDVVFANYNDGATFNTLSSAYFGGPSGFSSTPGAYFQTSWAYGVDVADVNNDGYLDVAFANYYDGVRTDINSTILLGPCIGLQQPDLFFPTFGAGDVAFADIDRYYMSKDRNPPTITAGPLQGKYLPNGTYVSSSIVEEEPILSASAVWNASLPSQPAGCNVTVTLSNNNGADWTNVTKGEPVNFTTTGKALRYRVELVSDGHNIDTPVFQDISITYYRVSWPYNLTLDVGDDGKVDWSLPGKFNATATLNESTMGLATVLMGIVPRTGVGNATVPFRFTSERPGVLRVYGLNITGNYKPETTLPLPDQIMTEDVALPNALNLNDYFRDLDGEKMNFSAIGARNQIVNISSNGTLSLAPRHNWYGTERITIRARDAAGEYADSAMDIEVSSVDDPPHFVATLPDINVTEGETVRGVFNLLDYVEDDDTPKTQLFFSVAEVTNRNVTVVMDSNDNVDVASRIGWSGTVNVTMKVSDGEASDTAHFNITVYQRNQPPTMASLPSIQMLSGQKMDRAFNLYNFTNDPDTARARLIFSVEENTNSACKVTISSDGFVNIQPERGWTGTTWITVNVSDGEYSARATFAVTVTPKPITEGLNVIYVYLIIILAGMILAVLAVDIYVRMKKAKAAQPPSNANIVSLFSDRSAGVQVVDDDDKGTGGDGKGGAGGQGDDFEDDDSRDGGSASRPSSGIAGGAGTGSGETGFTDADGDEGAEEVAMETSPLDAVTGDKGTGAGTGAGAAAGAGTGAGTGAAGVVAVEEPATGDENVMEVIPEAPAEKVPDMTPPSTDVGSGGMAGAGATGAGGAITALGGAAAVASVPGAEPPQEPLATGKKELPAKNAERDIGAGEVEQKPITKTARELLADLQRPRVPAKPEPPKPEVGLRSKATEVESKADELDQKEVKPLAKVRCAGCKSVIPVFKAERPLVITCPRCGKMGTLK